MLKKQQKWIAVLVTVTFAWLLQASALPQAAAGETGQPSAAEVDQAGDPGVEQAPGFFEQQGPDWNRRVKTKTVLIIIGAFLIISIIFALIKGVGAAPREGMSSSNPHRADRVQAPLTPHGGRARWAAKPAACHTRRLKYCCFSS